ncbi:enoyl-CoA hydratase/isomerase [Isoalcanivorax pacificus W11-5]|uniref:Enoyl-CoA hydratase/isomerase n=1 Tax=Isoalcanivorax pacificus W11-5 TaxID=391936 RepID=A0A0B4XLX3_9GAMM|nr:enoyl-CoA hydratase-related protein [Isoalcanivorax pacificus]AJD48141.1 enoyl-CoA hydratase/isomerase [Isoalcanivorax pacificus W11-5]
MSILLQYDGPVARITLNRPDKLNAFDDALIEDIIRCVTEAGDSDARVIVLAGAGKHFSAGGDLGWMRRMADKNWDENRADAARLAALMSTLDRAAKPVITRVQGAAYGGATGLACASDITIAADTARFCLSEVRIGLLPAVISPYVVRAIGARQARRYFMTAEVIDAARAVQIGMAHEAVPEAELDAAVDRCIEALLAGAPNAQLKAREIVDKVAGQPASDELIAWTAELIAGLRSTDEGREGLSAFLEKRAPSWRPH